MILKILIVKNIKIRVECVYCAINNNRTIKTGIVQIKVEDKIYKKRINVRKFNQSKYILRAFFTRNTEQWKEIWKESSEQYNRVVESEQKLELQLEKIC